ncbi:MAG: agarase [Tannerellaceae bacterium]|nr:agarase [Tannerellaceae bacterium]
MKHILILFSVLTAFLSAYGQKDIKKGYKYIQVESKPWIHGNLDTPWKTYDTKIVRNIINYEICTDFEVNKYGSRTDRKVNATGYYRVEKLNGRWWVVDPEGYLNIHTVINSLRPGGSERNKRVFDEKFQTMDKWMKDTADSLIYYGFTGTGSWSEDHWVMENNKGQEKQLSYAPNLNFMSSYGKKRGGTYQLPGNTGYPNQCIFVFDPEFEIFCDEHARQVLKYKGDKNLFGFFSDNEMPLGKKNLEGYLTLENKKDPGYLAARAWIESKGITEAGITDDHREAFTGYVAERYYRIVSAALKKYAPEYMYLGSRLHGGAKNVMPIIEAAGKYCDIISLNYYGVWTPEEDLMNKWEKVSGKPFMITEFYTKAMDAGLANTTGAGFTVHTQQDKGYAYQHFCLTLLESKSCVGWHFFKYQDNDPTAKNVDPSNIDSNKGIVNNDFDYYPDLMNLMKEFHINRYYIIDYLDE